MTPLRINNKTARHLWLDAQGLWQTPTGPLDILGMITQLGFVQLDSIQVVARAHHHILWSRNQNYREGMLDGLYRRDRSVFEHFTHDASLIPMQFLPYWQRQFQRKQAQLDRADWWRGLPGPAERAVIKNRIAAEGPLSTHAFDSKVDGPKQMWSRPPHKLALDYMWYAGELATAHRINFNKYYDLAERIFPPASAAIDDYDQIDWLCHAALDRMGFGQPGDVQRYWDAVSASEVREWIANAHNRLVDVEIETADGQWIRAIAPAAIEDRIAALRQAHATPSSRVRILNPFDPVIRDRNRLQRLFGFEYRVEMFVPAAKRQWGYYVFPILEGHRFVGRIEIKGDRKQGRLQVLKFWTEPGAQWPASRHQRLATELDRMRRFIGAQEIIWQSS